jgi:hypothetical protein
LDDLGAAADVEEIGSTDGMEERLAVVAVTDDPIERARERVAHVPLHVAAATFEYETL